ncbi:MAG: Thymidylate kinase [Candidatus Saccharibacteria bacterium]|nr:Thymidylate kinase [Candidatus Saccharibacteria bacterium]
MGIFIAIEGGDGSGKATHAKLLGEYMAAQGWNVFPISFPQYGKDSAYYAERYLNGDYGSADSVPADLGVLPYAIDRFAAREDILNHFKDKKGIVIADRYMASNLAHQGTKIADPILRKAFYDRTMITEYEVLGIPRATKNIVLIMPTQLAQSNVDKKQARSYTALKRDIHEADASHLDRAKANYEELCELFPDEFTAIQCAASDGTMKSIDDIQKEIRMTLAN